MKFLSFKYIICNFQLKFNLEEKREEKNCGMERENENGKFGKYGKSSGK